MWGVLKAKEFLKEKEESYVSCLARIMIGAGRLKLHVIGCYACYYTRGHCVSLFSRMLWSWNLAQFKARVPSRWRVCRSCFHSGPGSVLVLCWQHRLHFHTLMLWRFYHTKFGGGNEVWFITKLCRSLATCRYNICCFTSGHEGAWHVILVALLRHEFGTDLEAGVQGSVSHVTGELSGCPTSPSQWNLLMATSGGTAPRIIKVIVGSLGIWERNTFVKMDVRNWKPNYLTL